MNVVRIRYVNQLLSAAVELQVTLKGSHNVENGRASGEFSQIRSQHVAGPGVPDTEAVKIADPRANRELPIDLGPYTPIKRLGLGGMGEVWLATQAQPIKRLVAVKVIQAKIASQEFLLRFEAERQALAMMNHPHVAQILDAGTTRDGRPYFAMEYVAGTTLNDFCEREKLDVPARLALFTAICSGVQHAHQKGVIHRDLKPGNILVALEDGIPVPKVIDFGLAKACRGSASLTDQSVATSIHQVIGTWPYMSPEQASLDNRDIDTRSDIYSLGAILYEMLTGTTPHDPQVLDKLSTLQRLHYIREHQPPRPSLRLGAASPPLRSTIVGGRQSETQKLKRRLTGDLDCIVMKAIEKDRNRRYESAADLAADVNRYRHREPVVARPPSVRYRVHKFVRRNRGLVVSLTAMVLLLAMGTITSTWLAFLYRGEKLAAQRNLQLSERRAAETQAAHEALSSLLANLNAIELRNQGLSLETVMRDRLVEYGQDFMARVDIHPLTQAFALHGAAEILLSLGDSEHSRQFFNRAWQIRRAELGDVNPMTLRSHCFLGRAHELAGDSKLAIELSEQAYQLAVTQQKLDASLLLDVTAAYITALHRSESREQLAKALAELPVAVTQALQRLDSACLSSTMEIIVVSEQSGIAIPAIDSIQILDGLVRDSGDVARSEETIDLVNRLNAAACIYLHRHQPARALQILEDVERVVRNNHWHDLPIGVSVLCNLGECLHQLGQAERGRQVLEPLVPVLETNRELLGGEEIPVLNSLAKIYLTLEQFESADAMFAKALHLLHESLPASSVEYLKVLNGWTHALVKLEHFDRALELIQEGYQMRQKHLGPQHPKTLATLRWRARVFRQAGRLAESLQTYLAVGQLVQGVEGFVDLGLEALEAAVEANAEAGIEEVATTSELKRGPELTWEMADQFSRHIQAHRQGFNAEQRDRLAALLDRTRKRLEANEAPDREVWQQVVERFDCQ